MGKATLSDGSKTFIFPLPPETISESIAGDYAINAVLDTTAPNIRRKAAGTTMKLGRCLFISQGLKVDQTPYLATLRFWAKNQTKLQFVYNMVGLRVCYIKSANIDVKQYRNGKVVHFEADLELVEATPVVKTETKVPDKKITKREQDKKANAIKAKLKTPAKKMALGVAGNFDVFVSDLSQVTIKDEDKSTVYDFDDLNARLT